MDIKQLEAIEAKISTAKSEADRAKGSRDALMAQMEKDYGVKTIEEAEKLEADLTAQAQDLAAKVDESFAALQVAYAEAVG